MTLSQLLWNLFFAFLSALSGVVIGILWGRRQLASDRAQRIEILRANLVKAFRFNLDRIDQCLDYLQRAPPVIPNFRLDTATPTHILLMGRELFSDQGMFERFSWQRYQLDHLNAKLDYLHGHLASDSGTRLTPSPYDSLLQHLKVTQRDILGLLADYDATA